MRELVERLTAFGLSINQAKVYLSIIESSQADINIIAEATKIHRQDIYKILPKLEEMGLITKTIDRPTAIKAIPPDKALNHIITTQEQKAIQQISFLKETVNALAEEIERTRKEEVTEQKNRDIEAIFLITDNAINNKFDSAFENAKILSDGVFNFELMRGRLPYVQKRYKALADHGVKARMLLDNVKNDEDARKILKQVMPSTDNFTFKQGKEVTVKPYLIIDKNEIFITTQRKTPNNFPCVLWTNSKNIIAIYQENFDKAWNKGRPIIL